jgi:arylsulfatase A-like enzyme
VLGDASVDIAYRWIRQGDYKLIVPTSSHPWNNYLNTVQLFNLDSDPNESVNLANERPYRMIRQKLHEQLDVWWTP